MDDENQIPRLLAFLYGEAAEAAQAGASERLRRWSRAFDEWLAERGRNYKANTVKQSALAWRRLMGERRKMPWELSQTDIEQHTDWMKAEGYASTTISNSIGIISNFYRWCDQRQVDPEWEETPGGKSRLEVTARRLVEEIAAMRYVLRRTLKLATETGETREYVRLVEIYGMGCTRLVRLLRTEGDNYSQLEASIDEQIDQAIEELTEDWAL